MSRCPLPSTSRSLSPLRSRPNRRIVQPERESQTKPPLPRFQSTAKNNRSFLLALAISTSCPLQSEHTPAKRPGKQCGRPEPWPASRLPRLLRCPPQKHPLCDLRPLFMLQFFPACIHGAD